MGRLPGRVEKLEEKAGLSGGLKRWHRLQQRADEGESEEDAIAAYEAAHGPIGDDNCIIHRVVSAPRLQAVVH
jgi:hypothetical protein